MKNPLLLSLLLFLASTPLMAMEGQWKQEEEQKPADQQKKHSAPTLKDLCLKSFSKATDAQLLKTFAYNSHPEMGAKLWAHYPQSVIDRECSESLDKLVEAGHPVEVKVAMAKRLSKEKAQKLFDDVLDITNNMPDKIEFAFALFEEISALQTWQNAQTVAQLGPITISVAKVIIHTTRYIWMELLKQNGDSYFPIDMLNYENDKVFEQAALEELEKNKFYGKFLEEGPTLKELCPLAVLSYIPFLVSALKEKASKLSKAAIKDELYGLANQEDPYTESFWDQAQITFDINIKTQEEIEKLLEKEAMLGFGQSFEDIIYLYKNLPVVGPQYNIYFEKTMNLICTFFEEAQKREYEFPRKDKEKQ